MEKTRQHSTLGPLDPGSLCVDELGATQKAILFISVSVVLHPFS